MSHLYYSGKPSWFSFDSKKTMKQFSFIAILALIGLITKAQDRGADSSAIEKQVDAFFASWNRHDFSDMETYITPDCDWVNIVGLWWKDSKQVKFAHQFYHDRMFRNTPSSKKSITISFLSSDVALVHLLSHIGTFTAPNEQVMPEADDLATLIYVKKGEKWFLRAGENVVVNPAAQQFDPVKQMPK